MEGLQKQLAEAAAPGNGVLINSNDKSEGSSVDRGPAEALRPRLFVTNSCDGGFIGSKQDEKPK